MDKFVERANELIARLEQFGDMDSLKNEIAIQCAKDDAVYKSALNKKEAFFNCILDARILISEFNCPPLYDECVKALGVGEDSALRSRHLLQKLIEVAEFRSK